MNKYDKLYQDFYARKQQWAVLVTHRRAGLTTALIKDLVRQAKATDKKDARFAYIHPDPGYWDDALDYLLHETRDLGYRFNKRRLYVTFLNGAEIKIIPPDPSELQGLALDGVAIDDYHRQDPWVWSTLVLPCLVDQGGTAVLAGHTDIEEESPLDELYEDAGKASTWYSQKIKASESGIFDAEDLEGFKRDYSPGEYQRSFECQK